jgi:hypothetical protein
MKNIHLRIRLDEKTFSKLIVESEKNKKSRSEYVRDLILSTDLKTDPEIKRAINDLRKEVNRIGVNINQIAKNTNAGIYSESDRMHLIESQNELLEEFSKMKERVYSTS